jgi:hypothetical protein
MTNIANKFAVDQVGIANTAPETVTSRAALEKVLGGPVESCSAPNAVAVEASGFNVFFETIHQAYDEHRPLRLSPDNLWLTIAQGFAAIIGKNPEKYRSYFVEHEGKKKIVISRPTFVCGNFNNDWAGCFDEFSSRIRAEIGEENHQMIVSNFSTTRDIEKAASEVVLMDAVQSYFEYVVFTDCGIPHITLTGSVEDWQKVVEMTRALTKFEGMEWWLDHVHPIVEQFARAAGGDVDLEFWQNIYKGFSMSGGTTASGHLLKLMPYLKMPGSNQKIVNPLLKTGAETDEWMQDGVSTSMMVQALSNVPFIWAYHGVDLDYQFLAGHVGVGYDEETGTLSPIIGWAVRPNPESKTEETSEEAAS